MKQILQMNKLQYVMRPDNETCFDRAVPFIDSLLQQN